MLTGLYFKNWRSLRDVEITNLTPITVFIGANSSGKTNIVEALSFVQYSLVNSAREAVYALGGREKVQSFGAQSENVELKTALALEAGQPTVSDILRLEFAPDGRVRADQARFQGEINLTTAFNDFLNSNETTRWLGDAMGRGSASMSDLSGYEEVKHRQTLENRARKFITLRWQILQENFMPPTVLLPYTDPGNLHLIDPMARNVPLMLDFMRQENMASYDQLQNDMRVLLEHIADVDVRQDDRGIRIAVREKAFSGLEAPTVSAGTARILAMLTAYYALEMDYDVEPGLVVIEEPDTAIHPLLLGNLVDLLRSYTERKGYPRQFILTTHNPQMLNYFEPSEVRIVERDESGVTTVRPVDEKVAEVWRQHDGAFNLGSLWTTRLIGGVPQ